MPGSMSVDQRDLQQLARALKQEADGKQLRRDLRSGLKAAIEPAKAEVQAGLMSMATAGLPNAGEPLRAAVLAGLQVQVRTTGKTTGVRLRIKRTPDLRGFKNAPKRLQSRKGWRHPVYGNREVWVTQFGAPDYFDGPTRRHRGEYRAAVQAAMQDVAHRIASRRT